MSAADEVKQPVLRGEEGGNVRPADDRFLSSAAKRKRNAYVSKVEQAQAEDLQRDAPKEDPFAEVIENAVTEVQTRPEEGSTDE